MTCALKPRVNLTAESVCASSPTPPLQMEERAWREANDLATEPLGSAKLNAVGIRNLHMMHVLERIAAAFNDAGIPLLVMKGAALNLTLYTQLNERPMEDLDLLVRPENISKASSLLQQLGALRGESFVRDDFFPRFYYEVEYSIDAIYPVKIDLHVRPLRPLRYSRFVPADALWANARPVRMGNATILVPSVEDMVIHLAAHAAIHGCRRRMWLQDIQLWIAVHRTEINWSRLLATVEGWRLAPPVRTGLECAERVFGPEFPGEVVRRLSQMRANWRDRLALWQAPRDADHPIAHVLVNVVCTPGWRFTLAYLLAATIPDRRHMSDWYHRRHWAWLPCAHVLRWLGPVTSRIPARWRWFTDIASG